MRILPTPTPADVIITDVLNDYPKVGVRVGGGPPGDLPADWRDRVGAGELVPGVTARQGLEPDGSIVVPDDSEDRMVSRYDVIVARVGAAAVASFLGRLPAAALLAIAGRPRGPR